MSPHPDQTLGHPHVDEDSLALYALGEPGDPWVSDHVSGCAQCHAEVESYTRVVNAGRALDASDGALVQPPDTVWDNIAAELGLSVARPGSGTSYDARPAAAPATVSTPADTGAAQRDADVLPLTRRPPRARSDGAARPSTSRAGLLVAASIASALVGIGATLGWQALTSDEGAVVASAPLAPLPEKVGTGEAELHGTGPDRELTMTLDVDPPEGSYLQVWLMSPDATRMVPVGVIENGNGFWRVPADLDIGSFPLVDVSIEPFDGDSAHSGDSVVRGTLDG